MLFRNQGVREGPWYKETFGVTSGNVILRSFRKRYERQGEEVVVRELRSVKKWGKR